MVINWAVAGVLVPGGILIASLLQGGVFWSYLALAVWPSSIFLMVIHEDILSPSALLIYAMSFGVNVVFYSALGTMVWLLFGGRSKLRPDPEHLLKGARRDSLWTLGTGVLLTGGGSLILVYIGTLPIKLSILLSTMVAIFLVRQRPVYPFAQLLTNHVGPYLDHPVLVPLKKRLEAQKTRSLLLVGLIWLLIQGGVSTLGFVNRPSLTQAFASDWLWSGYTVVIAGGLGLAGAAATLWLSFHLFASGDFPDQKI
jgi:hypothetical protein